MSVSVNIWLRDMGVYFGLDPDAPGRETVTPALRATNGISPRRRSDPGLEISQPAKHVVRLCISRFLNENLLNFQSECSSNTTSHPIKFIFILHQPIVNDKRSVGSWHAALVRS